MEEEAPQAKEYQVNSVSCKEHDFIWKWVIFKYGIYCQQNLMDVNSQVLNNTVLSWPTCELKADSQYKT